jgi:hypothetical protein
LRLAVVLWNFKNDSYTHRRLNPDDGAIQQKYGIQDQSGVESRPHPERGYQLDKEASRADVSNGAI